MECETVRIVSPVSDDNPLGYIVINASDFADGMTRYEEPAPVKPGAAKKSDK